MAIYLAWGFVGLLVYLVLGDVYLRGRLKAVPEEAADDAQYRQLSDQVDAATDPREFMYTFGHSRHAIWRHVRGLVVRNLLWPWFLVRDLLRHG